MNTIPLPYGMSSPQPWLGGQLGVLPLSFIAAAPAIQISHELLNYTESWAVHTVPLNARQSWKAAFSSPLPGIVLYAKEHPEWFIHTPAPSPLSVQDILMLVYQLYNQPIPQYPGQPPKARSSLLGGAVYFERLEYDPVSSQRNGIPTWCVHLRT